MATKIQRSRRVKPSEKATYHQITGAGKRHIKREFFGLSREDETAIRDLLEDLVDKNLEKER